MKDIILAIHCKWFKLIMRSQKVAELRRQLPNHIQSGSRIIFYFDGYLHGEAIVADVDRQPAAITAQKWADFACLTEEQALIYLQGGRSCGAILLERPRRYDKPRKWCGARPQNFIYF